jgi:hypothetical protein
LGHTVFDRRQITKEALHRDVSGDLSADDYIRPAMSRTALIWVAILAVIGIILGSIAYAARTDPGESGSTHSSGKEAVSPGA